MDGNRFQGSKIKDRIRIRHESEAQRVEMESHAAVDKELAARKKGRIYFSIIFWGIAFFYSCSQSERQLEENGNYFGGVLGNGFWLLLFVFVIVVSIVRGRKFCEKEHEKVQAAHRNAQDQIKAEIAAYEREVEESSQKIMLHPDRIANMVDHVLMMFQRMVSHAENAPHIRFIEADFIYIVEKQAISFQYMSNYINPQDNYVFDKERYRDLKTDAECEGLAKALAVLVIRKMKSLYPPNSLSITLEHNDASVLLHFKSANPNFVISRDIL